MSASKESWVGLPAAMGEVRVVSRADRGQRPFRWEMSPRVGARQASSQRIQLVVLDRRRHSPLTVPCPRTGDTVRKS